MLQTLKHILLTFVLAGILQPSMAQPAASELHIVLLGDSNTWLGGDDCSQPKGWSKWFSKILRPASCRSYARSGATWTNTVTTQPDTAENTGKISDDNVIFNQLLRLRHAVEAGDQPTPDLIIISAGTNDAWFEKQRPGCLLPPAETAFATSEDILTARQPSEVLTLAEAVRHNCLLLQAWYPEARIVLLTPLQSTAVSLSDIRRAGDIIADCADRLGLGVIRQDENTCVRRADEARKKRYTYDGTHTNEAGAREMGRFVANHLLKLLQTPLPAQ